MLEAPVSARGRAPAGHGAARLASRASSSREGKAELSFCSLLARELPDWPAGPLTVAAGLVRSTRTRTASSRSRRPGSQVRAALERSAGCVADPDELGRNCDSLEGAEYELDLSRPEGHRVVSLTRDGRDDRRRRRPHRRAQLVPGLGRRRLSDVEARRRGCAETGQPPRPARGRRARGRAPARSSRRKLEGWTGARRGGQPTDPRPLASRRSFATSRLALAPGAPVTPPPGCVPEPQR